MKEKLLKQLDELKNEIINAKGIDGFRINYSKDTYYEAIQYSLLINFSGDGLPECELEEEP